MNESMNEKPSSRKRVLSNDQVSRLQAEARSTGDGSSCHHQTAFALPSCSYEVRDKVYVQCLRLTAPYAPSFCSWNDNRVVVMNDETRCNSSSLSP